MVVAALGLVATALGVGVPLVWRMVRRRRTPVEGQTVFVTGGSEGIGKALALEFVRRGAHVVVMARGEAKLQDAVKELKAAQKSASQKVGYQVMDVTDYANVQSGMRTAAAEFGSPAFLMVCAGSAQPGYFLEQEPEVFDRSMRLNYMGTVHTVKSVAPMMQERAGGHIMIVASAAAVISFIGYSSYAPTKFALRGLADSLRNELCGFGIRVAICYPPDTDTPGFKEENKNKPEETKACFPPDAYPPEAVARKSVSSLLAGDYHIQSVDFLQNLLVSSMSGATPRFCTLLEACLAPLLAIVEQVFCCWFDFQARRYARRVQGSTEEKKSR